LVLITHNLGLVACYADWVNVIYAGKLAEQGSTRDVHGDPRHPDTVGLLHSVPRLGEPRKATFASADGVRLPPTLPDRRARMRPRGP
jgi:ABC-type dipeptide/oligopeptide/nickel transport system ATPase component